MEGRRARRGGPGRAAAWFIAVVSLISALHGFLIPSLDAIVHGRAMSLCALLEPYQVAAPLALAVPPSAALQKVGKKELDALIDESPVLIVSKAYCPFCSKAKAALDSLGAEYTVLELENFFRNPLVEDVAAVQDYMLERTGARSVPRVFIGGRFVGGCDELMGKKLSGELQELLLAAGAMAPPA